MRLAEWTRRRHGVVSHEELGAIGIRGNAVTGRVKAGRLHRHYRGVYSVGHARLTREGRWLAAVLASGPGAVLSHLDAAVLWGIYERSGSKVHVITSRRSRKGVPGIHLHRVRSLTAAETATVNGIPVTSVARTLVDLTDVVGRERLTRIIREAEYLRLLDLTALDAAIARANGRKRLSTLAAAVSAHRPGTIIRSELEHQFLELCRAADIPGPETNVPTTINGKACKLDCLWRDHGVVVELDGGGAHATPDAFESDRARDAALSARGLRPLRYTWRRVTQDQAAVAAELRAVVGQSSAPSSRNTRRMIASEEA